MSQLVDAGFALALRVETRTFAFRSTTIPREKNPKKPAAMPRLTIQGRGGRSEAAERHDASPQSPDGPDLGTP